MIDPDAVLGVLQALADEIEDAERDPLMRTRVDVSGYRDRIVALAEDVGICGDLSPWHRAVQCDLSDGHRGLHSGLTWEAARPWDPDAVIAPQRVHWPEQLPGAPQASV